VALPPQPVTSVTDAALDATTSGATRVPGEYTVAWDGVEDDGNVIADGDYVLFVEAARRGGAYDITTTPIAVTNSGFSVQLPDSGELTAVSAELVA
jgi:thiamine biosynthesis lipoprotein